MKSGDSSIYPKKKKKKARRYYLAYGSSTLFMLLYPTTKRGIKIVFNWLV